MIFRYGLDFATMRTVCSCAAVLLAPSMALAITPTVTTLSVSPAGSVSLGTVVTLTATVTANGSPVSPGLVVFCKAAAAHCIDAAIVGQAQLIPGGLRL